MSNFNKPGSHESKLAEQVVHRKTIKHVQVNNKKTPTTQNDNSASGKFLSSIVKDKKKVYLNLIGEHPLVVTILKYDNYSLIVEHENGLNELIMKHVIRSISFVE